MTYFLIIYAGCAVTFAVATLYIPTETQGPLWMRLAVAALMGALWPFFLLLRLFLMALT